MQHILNQKQYSSINLPMLSKEPIGQSILKIIAITSAIMILYGLFYKNAGLGTLVSGFIAFSFSIWALGSV